MRILAQILGPFIEAWGEVKVQRARVILSLVGVVAAVAAMSTVIALGTYIVQAQQEQFEAQDGRQTTLTLTGFRSDDGSGNTEGGGLTEVAPGVYAEATDPGMTDSDEDGSGKLDPENLPAAVTGRVNDPMGYTMKAMAERFEIPYWSRKLQDNVTVKELIESEASGQFRGRPTETGPWDYGTGVEVTAVDPSYQVIFRTRVLQGRWLTDSDVEARVTPTVINENLWKRLGRPDINDPLILSSNDEQPRQFRIVGIAKSQSQWDGFRFFVLYDAWQYMRTNTTITPELKVWAAPDQIEQARQMLPAALTSMLGDGWQVDIYGGESSGSVEDTFAMVRMLIMGIGGIVIFLGALGLLNVAVVTVKQRMREIGIRRAMGASASRIFFAVFMESVVATFIAGVVGVGIAIVVLRLLPLESMDIYLQDVPGFPMKAALAGVGISVTIGALCGIIPAVAAVRVKPIDAIRS